MKSVMVEIFFGLQIFNEVIYINIYVCVYIYECLHKFIHK